MHHAENLLSMYESSNLDEEAKRGSGGIWTAATAVTRKSTQSHAMLTA